MRVREAERVLVRPNERGDVTVRAYPLQEFVLTAAVPPAAILPAFEQHVLPVLEDSAFRAGCRLVGEGTILLVRGPGPPSTIVPCTISSPRTL